MKTSTADSATVTTEQALDTIRAMDTEFLELTGHQAFLFPAPGSGTGNHRFVFADVTVPSLESAVDHMTELLDAARNLDGGRLWWCWA